ncbi:MAG: hypothetical protein GFH24_608346n48 [Chloroflexi bacterium AL-N5]|nr:hypothetical protein [Chloroflexi bacterium AL-N5]
MHAAGEHLAGTSLSVLGMLADKSLLRRMHTGRYELHDLVQQFVLEYLQHSEPEYEEVGERHCWYYLTWLVQEVESAVNVSSMRATLDSKAANIRAAWSWAGTHRYMDLIAQTADSLKMFYKMKGYAQDAVQAFGAALDAFDQPDSESASHAMLLGKLLTQQGSFYQNMGRYALARRLFQRTLASSRALGSKREIATVLGKLGFLAIELGEYAEARQLMEAALHK